jgi:Iap family predicted aminopeptidase
MFDILSLAGLPALVVQFFICLDSFRTAPSEAQEFHNNISNIRQVLGQLDKTLGADQDPSTSQLRSNVKDCLCVLGPMLDISMGLANGNRPWQRFIWIYRREKYQRMVNDISLKLQIIQLSAFKDCKQQRDTVNLLAETVSRFSVLLEEVLNRQMAEETGQEFVILSPDGIAPKFSTPTLKLIL